MQMLDSSRVQTSTETSLPPKVVSPPMLPKNLQSPVPIAPPVDLDDDFPF